MIHDSSEIRIKESRYESGYYCIIADEGDDEMWEKFGDLTGGDNDFFGARDWFKQADNDFILTLESSEYLALTSAMSIYKEKYKAI